MLKKTGTARKYLYYLDAPPHPVLKFLYRYKEFNKINYSCKLYNWSSFLNLDAKYDSTINTQPINELKTIAPKGWHIPSIEEWQELIQYISTQNNVKFEKSSSYPNIGYSLKGTKSWFKRRERYAGSPVDSLNGDDEFGFSALAVGYGMMSDSKASKYKKYSYENRSKSTIWWTSTESSNNSAVTIEISSDTLTIHDGDKRNLYSIRCVKDSE